MKPTDFKCLRVEGFSRNATRTALTARDVFWTLSDNGSPVGLITSRGDQVIVPGIEKQLLRLHSISVAL
jgi:hypothetical protein